MKKYLAALMVSIIMVSPLQAQFKRTQDLEFSHPIEIPQSPKINLWKTKRLANTFAMPILLISGGLYAMHDNDILNRRELQEERNEYIPRFRHHVDDYLQYAPIAAVYGLNAAGVKSKNDFRNRTALLIKSELIMATITYSLKKIVAEPRPDTGSPNSFPSGHTAQAFAAATFMIKEYGDRNVLYSIGAYSLATGIGTLRMMNNRHWMSDVLAGAGIGILSTNLAYLTHQYKWNKKRAKKNSTLVIPAYSNGTGMISVLRTI